MLRFRKIKNRFHYCPPAYWTEFRRFIGSHTAILTRPPISFRLICGAFHKTDNTLLIQILPLAREIHLCSHILLPRFHIESLVRSRSSVISIFIHKSGKTVTEFVHDHWTELSVPGRSDGI